VTSFTLQSLYPPEWKSRNVLDRKLIEPSKRSVSGSEKNISVPTGNRHQEFKSVVRYITGEPSLHKYVIN
jgi:hypothetical protein